MTTLEQLERLELRVKFIGEHKTLNTKRGKENYNKDLREIPVLIADLSSKVDGNENFKRRFDDAVTSFNYWK